MTVWDRPERPARPVPLDRQRIVDAAIALADEGGLEAVSLRKVAARLDAGPMRLYGFISTKEELFDLMVDEVQAEILPESRPRDWREALSTLAHRTRETALRHEWLADLLGGRPALGPNGLAVTETTLAALDGHTDIDTVMRAVETVSAYATGAIRREIANLRAERASGLSKHDWQRANGPHVTRMLATGRFPALAKAVHDGTDVDAETSFATGLDWVLDAVAAKLPRHTG
ncbi:MULTISPECIES: TetR/AcrR family transcriptional regulator [Streptomyces]|uniref:TetR/AcrR family transcriptional regulator n=1 Tax=Streptomyces scabiei TaxID=1930 RepID=UPI00055B8D9F|nr:MULTISPECIES: TetR/AcrR family transcriptional regulator [Streptomyces]MBP5872665.1 TetR/AcrR family transcriptional regulator [Streptomyces sp. LBUM 1485]MBP5934066.1 TetR/AcrR family transcriptional regulator [Streptomyces sp. LBUM 1479]MBP5896126.1 TetR/AcrR family transcriptional regulator [Streptomyces sp. LBUM 1481]MBP5911086.1 TetR/AcrR family transcriptional regulator [Streptomyces sp. LBUM 1486]MBP5926450.1 TetR/AcrR family transcriptional regulator [Streptomyces sp. LBUM 1483]